MNQAIVLPKEVQDVRARLSATDPETRYDAVISFFGLPSLDELPRPGVVSGWGEREWVELAHRLGFTQGDKTRHTQVYEHPKFPSLRINTSVSGDPRAARNTAADFRRAYIDELGEMADLLAAAIDLIRDPSSKFPTQALTVDGVRDACQLMIATPGGRAKTFDYLKANIRSDLISDGTMDRITRTLKVLQKEFDFTVKRSLEAVGLPTPDAERSAAMIKSELPLALSENQGSALQMKLTDLLENLRGAEAAERAAKIAEREAKEQERLKRAKERQEAQGPKAQFESTVKAHRTLVDQELRGIGDAVSAIMARVGAVRSTLSASPLPGWPEENRETKATLENLEVQNAALQEALGAMGKELEATKAQLTKVQQDAKAAHELLESVGGDQGWQPYCLDLMEQIRAHLSHDSFRKVVLGVEEVRALLQRETPRVMAGDIKPKVAKA